MPLRLLLFSWKDPTHPWAGGSEVYLHEIAKRWVRDGHTVTWFSASYNGSQADETIGGISFVRRSFMPAVFLEAGLWYWIRSPRNFDCIVDCMNGIPFFSPLFSRLPKLILVHHIHVPHYRDELPFVLAQLAEFIETRLVPLIYRNVPWVTVSESTRSDLLKLVRPGTQISIVYNAVAEGLKPRVKSATPTIAYVGRLKRYKRVDLLIRAFADLRSKFPSAKLIIAGNGDATADLHHLISRLDVGGVELRGFVSEREKSEILGSAWVLAMPSSVEGWGLSVIEANACGTPAVAFNVPGLRDSVRHGQTGLVANTRSDFQHFLELLIANAELRDRLGAAAIEFASRFNWDSSANTMLGVLHLRSHRLQELRQQRGPFVSPFSDDALSVALEEGR